MKLCHLKLWRILRISGKQNSDKVASTIVINSFVNIFPKTGEIFSGLIFQINIRNFRDFHKLRFAIFATFAICEIAIFAIIPNNPIWFLGGIAISRITQFGFESFLQLWKFYRRKLPFRESRDLEHLWIRSLLLKNCFKKEWNTN